MLNKKTGEGKMFFSTKSLYSYLLGKRLNDYLFIKHNDLDTKIIPLKVDSNFSIESQLEAY